MERTQKPRVFLSSALEGLEDLRSIIIDLFKNEKGYLPIYYGDKCSGSLTGRPGIVEQCLGGVRSSDAFFLIVDRRYGKPDQKDDDGNTISLTELEFLEANKQKLNIYIFCRTEVWIAHKIWKTNPYMNFKFDKRYDYSEQLMMFLTKLKREHYIPRFETAVDLKNALNNIELSVDLLKYQPSLIDEHENLEVSP